MSSARESDADVRQPGRRPARRSSCARRTTASRFAIASPSTARPPGPSSRKRPASTCPRDRRRGCCRGRRCDKYAPGLRGPLPGGRVRHRVGAARRLGLPRALQDARAASGRSITESALDETLLRLAPRAGRARRRVSHQVPGSRRRASASARCSRNSTLPWTMPWRVDHRRRPRRAHPRVGSGAGSRAAVADRRQPAGSSRDARHGAGGRRATARSTPSDLNAFTDLAAEMGWEYALVDANWNLMQTGTIEDVIAHAKAKNVGLLLLVQLRRPAQRRHRGAARPHVDARARAARSSEAAARGASRASRWTSGRATSRIASRSIATS